MKIAAAIRANTFPFSIADPLSSGARRNFEPVLLECPALAAGRERKAAAFKSPWNLQDGGRRGASTVVTSLSRCQMIASLIPTTNPLDRRRSPTSHAFVSNPSFLSGLVVVTPRYVCHPVLDYASLSFSLVQHSSRRGGPCRLCLYNTAHCLLGLTLIHAYPDTTRDKRDPARLFWQSERRSRRR